MEEKNKAIKSEELEKITGGKSYWDGQDVRFSSEDGDWHQGDKFMCCPVSARQWEYIVLQDNGVFIDNMTGHKYNGKRYRMRDNVYVGETTVTDYDIMMKKWSLEFIQ